MCNINGIQEITLRRLDLGSIINVRPNNEYSSTHPVMTICFVWYVHLHDYLKSFCSYFTTNLFVDFPLQT